MKNTAAAPVDSTRPSVATMTAFLAYQATAPTSSTTGAHHSHNLTQTSSRRPFDQLLPCDLTSFAPTFRNYMSMM